MSDKGDNSLTLLLLCLTMRVNVPQMKRKQCQTVQRKRLTS